MAAKRLSAENLDLTTKNFLQAMLSDIQNAGVSAAVATDLGNLYTTVAALVVDVAALRASIAAAHLTLSAHTHGGVTAGAASTSAIAAVAAPSAVTSSAPSAITATAIAAAQVVA